MNQKISTQTAILLGSVIIAVGVFLGLRGKNEPPPPPPPQPAQMPIAQAPAPPPPATPQVDRSAVEKEVQAALGKQKKALTDKCLAPSLAKQPEPKIVKWSFNFTFDASGKQIARGVKEDRATSRADVTQCVSDTLTEVSVSPPGQSVFVEVPLELP